MGLHADYILEENADKKLDILMEMALKLKPELYQKYPLLSALNNKKR